MTKTWKHINTIVDSDPFELNGMNIREFKWRSTGESIKVQDPLYGRQYTFNVYEISNGTESVRFAAGEFSNCIWGVYQEKG